MTAGKPSDPRRPTTPQRIGRLPSFYAMATVWLMLLLVGGLIAYKATASIAVLRNAAVDGAFPERHLLIMGEPAGARAVFRRSATYLAIVWPALLFGILISAAVRTLVSPTWLAERLGRKALRTQVAAGALAGAPLMLCSCCVAPIFTAAYERSRRLGPSLAILLAAPSLNPAALALTFMFFAPAVAWTRLLLALGAVLVGSLFTARLVQVPAFAVPHNVNRFVNERHALGRAFARSCMHVTVRTIPVILVGIVVAMAFADRLPMETAASTTSTAVAVALAAMIALPLALPTFFEVPLALSLLATGAPAGVAVAVLFAGPAVNLPSLVTIAHAAGWKVSTAIAAFIWTLAVIGGFAVS